MRTAALVLAIALAACGRGDRPEPALIVQGEIDGVHRLAQVTPRGDEVREVLAEIPGEVTSALVLDGGRAMLVAIRPPQGAAEVWRVEASPYRATRIYTGPGAAVLEAASRDGQVISVGAGRVLFVEKKAVLALDPPKGSKWRLSDVSEDGTRLLVAFGPDGPDCPRGASDLQCRLEVWGYDRDEPDAGWRVIARADGLVAYNGVFVPGSGGERIVFHRAVADPSCPGPWGCRLEEMVEIGWDGAGERVLHRGAWTPRFASDGKTIAAATIPAGELVVGPLGGELAEISDEAHYVIDWSPDDRWITYWARGEGGPAALVGRDGKHRRVLDDGRPIGWLARPLPAGKVVPTKKTQEDVRAEALARARGHARAGEPVEAFGTRDELEAFLSEDRRGLAVIPEHLLCAIRREVPFFVLGDADGQFLVVTNRLADGEVDANPHRGAIPQDPPADVGAPVGVTFGDAIELVGVEMPARVRRGDTFAVTLHHRLRSRPPGDWKIFVHFDGAGMRFQGDHPAPACGLARWRPGDHVIDRFEVRAGDDVYPPGEYRVYAGWFTGRAPSFENLEVTAGGASDRVDDAGRVLLGTIQLE